MRNLFNLNLKPSFINSNRNCYYYYKAKTPVIAADTGYSVLVDKTNLHTEVGPLEAPSSVASTSFAWGPFQVCNSLDNLA